VPAADQGDRPVGHQVLVPELVDRAEVLVGGGQRDDAPPVRAEHARRAQVRTEGDRPVDGWPVGSGPGEVE